MPCRGLAGGLRREGRPDRVQPVRFAEFSFNALIYNVKSILSTQVVVKRCLLRDGPYPGFPATGAALSGRALRLPGFERARVRLFARRILASCGLGLVAGVPRFSLRSGRPVSVATSGMAAEPSWLRAAARKRARRAAWPRAFTGAVGGVACRVGQPPPLEVGRHAEAIRSTLHPDRNVGAHRRMGAAFNPASALQWSAVGSSAKCRRPAAPPPPGGRAPKKRDEAEAAAELRCRLARHGGACARMRPTACPSPWAGEGVSRRKTLSSP